MKSKKKIKKEKVKVKIILTKFQCKILNSTEGCINKTHLFLKAISNFLENSQDVSVETIRVFSNNEHLSGKTLTFLIPKESYLELTKIAKKHKRTLSAICRYALAIYLKDLTKELSFIFDENFLDYLPQEIE